MTADKWILIAVIGKAQGLRGQVRLKFFSETAQSLRHYQHFYDKNGIVYTVKSLQFQKETPIIAFNGITSREEAEKLAGRDLFIKRSQLPEISEEDVFYHEDLLGFTVLNTHGERIGTVSGFFNFGGGDLLELTLAGHADKTEIKNLSGKGKDKALKTKIKQAKPIKELIPFSKAAIVQIDIAASRLVIDAFAAGLLTAPAAGEAEAQTEAKDK